MFLFLISIYLGLLLCEGRSAEYGENLLCLSLYEFDYAMNCSTGAADE